MGRLGELPSARRSISARGWGPIPNRKVVPGQRVLTGEGAAGPARCSEPVRQRPGDRVGRDRGCKYCRTWTSSRGPAAGPTRSRAHFAAADPRDATHSNRSTDPLRPLSGRILDERSHILLGSVANIDIRLQSFQSC